MYMYYIHNDIYWRYTHFPLNHDCWKFHDFLLFQIRNKRVRSVPTNEFLSRIFGMDLNDKYVVVRCKRRWLHIYILKISRSHLVIEPAGMNEVGMLNHWTCIGSEGISLNKFVQPRKTNMEGWKWWNPSSVPYSGLLPSNCNGCKCPKSNPPLDLHPQNANNFVHPKWRFENRRTTICAQFYCHHMLAMTDLSEMMRKVKDVRRPLGKADPR